MQKLKVGIIGAGMAFERLHYPAYQELSDRYDIVALVDENPEKARNWASRLGLDQSSAYGDWREMIKRDDLDVVDIMVPIPFNFEVTEAVAQHLSGKKKGIICEKPLAPSLDQARSARDLAKKHNLPIMIAENYRYSQEMDIIRDLIRNKRVGDIFYFIQNRVVDVPHDMAKDTFQAKEWRQHPAYPGGAITDVAVHDMAALHHIFGPVDRLHAFGQPLDMDFSPYSAVTVNLQFKSGVVGQFAFFCAGKEMQRPLVGLRIFGSQGMIYLEERDAGTINLAFNDGRSEQIPYQPQKGFYNELLNFYNALTGSEPISVTPEMEYGDLKAIHHILASIEESKVVSVDQDPAFQPGYQQPTGVRPQLQH